MSTGGYIELLPTSGNKPAAQIAHLVFADTKANAEKTKRAIFCQRSPRIMRIEI